MLEDPQSLATPWVPLLLGDESALLRKRRNIYAPALASLKAGTFNASLIIGRRLRTFSLFSIVKLTVCEEERLPGLATCETIDSFEAGCCFSSPVCGLHEEVGGDNVT